MKTRIVTDRARLCRNAETVLGWCREHNVSAAFVGKCICADPALVPAVLNTGFVAYADSREENLRQVTTGLPRLLLRIGIADNADEIVACSDISQQSELVTIKALAAAAARAGRRHKVVLMIDLGDLREGIFFENRDEILAAARAVAEEPSLELYGTGVNLTCYGGIIPDETNLGRLVGITEWLRRETGAAIPMISGGNSSSLSLLRAGRMPAGVNFLRIGEAVLLGTDTAVGDKFPELYDDAFVLEAPLVELKTKPSKPIGTSSVNAFGEVVTFEDKGPILRGILAVGRQDINPDGLTPLDEGVEIIGGSSDHLLVDLTRTSGLKVGDTLRFKLDYGALLKAFTSRYIEKIVK